MDKVIIFFSWQSDLPKETNTNLIKTALNKVIKEIPSHNFVLDEATRYMSGSENIPNKIIEKVKYSDIFICDITSINSHQDIHRIVTNPNVVFELGYAVSILGWRRVILLFNTSLGQLSDVPFNFDRQRISKYNTDDLQKNKNECIKNLVELISRVIVVIVDENPT